MLNTVLETNQTDWVCSSAVDYLPSVWTILNSIPELQQCIKQQNQNNNLLIKIVFNLHPSAGDGWK